MGIGQKLRERRKELGLSRNQLAKMIHVSPSSISNYENEVSFPKTDILLSLISTLEVDANYLCLGDLSNKSTHTSYEKGLAPGEEEEAFSKYRKLIERGKRLVRLVIDEEYERMLEEEWVEYYCIKPGMRKLHCGFLLDRNGDRIRFRKKYELEGMEYCFQIQAEHYEPFFKKHSILAMKSTPAEHNEIGIFCWNDTYYMRILYKRGQECRLCALNVNEPDIEVTDIEQLECIGTVLGQIYGAHEFVPSDAQE